MARLAHSLGEKGSQKWIRKLVNEEPEILNSQIRKNLNLPNDERIEWLSPLEDEGYKEYQDEAFLEKLHVKLEKVPLNEFWPRGGPQWDALGKSSSGKLLLVEAKSHISELMSNLKAIDKNSIELIQKSLKETKDYLNSKSELDWSKCFYQYTNRLAHLRLLRKNGLLAYLVFVYFINDLEMKGPTTVHEWNGAIRLLHSCLGIGRHKLTRYIGEVFVGVNQLLQDRAID
jgi:hypothetical protein